MTPHLYTAANVAAALRSTAWLVRVLADSLDDNCHVFVEFMIPSGRQIDLLILTRNGAYCIEARNKRYVDVRANRCWTYRNSDDTVVDEPLHNGTENPCQRAISNADYFTKWVTEDMQLRFPMRRPLPHIDVFGDIRDFVVFPAVVVPARPAGII